MQDVNARDRIQKQITHWIKVIQDFEMDLSGIDRDSKEYLSITRLQSEYKGRIYASRFFADVIGFDFNTDFNNIK